MNPTERNPVTLAQEMERRMADIARTRRPTEEESQAACAAYRAAKNYLIKTTGSAVSK